MVRLTEVDQPAQMKVVLCRVVSCCQMPGVMKLAQKVGALLWRLPPLLAEVRSIYPVISYAGFQKRLMR